jgi:2-polyprenyl-6-methoxyphenol hydroxylase-like FAD-dependent oxidoreductase
LKNIAVVGGSFSGLALALTLQRTSGVRVRVFEARSEQEMQDVNGSIYLHDGELLLKRLGLGEVWTRLTTDADGVSAWVLQQVLISAMTNSLEPGTIRYRSRIGAINVDSGGCLQCLLGQRSYGGFDLVVGADGLTSTLRLLVPPELRSRIALIGDSRVQFGREPFLGALRINFGAGRALDEGVRLAALIASADQEHADEQQEGGHDLGGFSLVHWRKTRYILNSIGVCAVLALVLLLWHLHRPHTLHGLPHALAGPP